MKQKKIKLIKKAGLCGRPAQDNELQIVSYQGTQIMSNLKESIGELLLFLQRPMGQNEEKKGYSLLEILLKQYLESKYQGK
jgi:hypothetical protein